MIKNFRIELILLSILLINIFFSHSADLIFVNFFQNINQYINEENCKYCSSDYLKEFFIRITELGDSLWYFIISVLLVTFCFIINKIKILKNSKKYVDAVFFSNIFLIVSLIITGLYTQILKHIVGRPRPNQVLLENNYDFNFFTTNSNFHSFPSGHTSTIFTIALILCFLFPKIKYFFILLATIIAFSRVVVGAHYFTDVLAGIVVSYAGYKTAKLILSGYFKFKDYQTNINSLFLIFLLLFVLAVVLSVGPSLDLFISSVFYYENKGFILQSFYKVTIFFRQILLPLLIIYILFIPFFSKLPLIKKIFFGYVFKLKDIFFIWSLMVFNVVFVVNIIMKNMWGRVRPNDVVGFGGADYFTPWYQLSNQCNVNCSFVSGDAAVGFSLIIFYFLTKKEIYIWLSLLLGFALGTIRIMEGGHFFSDIIFACIFVFAFTYLLCSHYKSKIWSRENYYIVLGCVILALLKVIAIASTDFNLYGDEAQYWLWSRDLSFGYFSKPPLLPWLISFVTYFFGDSFFVLKTIPILLYIFSSFLIYMLSTKLFKNRLLSFFCAMAFFLMPAVSVSSFLLSTDVVLILLWVASLIQVLNIKNNPHYLNFLALGILLGLAFLAKYAAIYFILGLVLLLIIEKNYRFAFLKSKLKLALFIITLLIILMPNILWNIKNNWLTFTHTVDNASLDKININAFGFIEFILSQIIMIGPFLFFGVFYFLYKKIKILENEKFLICFSLPALFIVSIESFLVRANANWAAVSLVTLMILFISIIYKFNKKIIHLNNYFNILIGFILYAMIGTSYSLGAFDRISGMKEFVELIEINKKSSIKNIVVSDRLLFANLNFELYKKNIEFFSTIKPGEKISHHFQLSNPLPSNFSENFLFIGNTDEIDYLQENKYVKIITEKSFPFAKEKIIIYEVSFDEIYIY